MFFGDNNYKKQIYGCRLAPKFAKKENLIKKIEPILLKCGENHGENNQTPKNITFK